MPGVTIVVHRGDVEGKIVASVKADSSARFKVQLPPGTYTLQQKNPGGVAKTVTVKPGKYARATVWEAVP